MVAIKLENHVSLYLFLFCKKFSFFVVPRLIVHVFVDIKLEYDVFSFLFIEVFNLKTHTEKLDFHKSYLNVTFLSAGKICSSV